MTSSLLEGMIPIPTTLLQRCVNTSCSNGFTGVRILSGYFEKFKEMINSVSDEDMAEIESSETKEKQRKQTTHDLMCFSLGFLFLSFCVLLFVVFVVATRRSVRLDFETTSAGIVVQPHRYPNNFSLFFILF